MKILAVGDLHRTAVKVPEDVDCVFIVGDFTNADSPDFVEETLNSIKCDVLAIPGNMDKKEVLDILENRGVSVHRKTVDYKGFKIFGFGGSSITPFNTPFEFDDEQIEEMIKGYKADIALFHDTPHGFFDWIGGKSVGSMAIRKWIETSKPKLVFCAHIHEYKGVAKFNDTLIVKVPPACKKEGVLVELQDLNNIIIRFINLE
ncbi:MAG TPA: metallophosphoesterase [Archaeoglobus profundus]|nr:metallophosphoesterase [Archaeoglobus profundus]